MTTDTLAAPTQTRPPHIPREWWYRATWHARQQAINAHLRNTRPSEPTIDHDAIAHAARLAEAQNLTPTELDNLALIEHVEHLLNEHAPVDQIITSTGRKIGTLEGRMRRAGRADLARQLGNIRNAMRRTGCPDCGKPIWPNATRCNACGNVETGRNRRKVVIENLTEMLDEDPTLRMGDAARRLGYKSENGLNKMLLRAERHDLISKLAVNGHANGRNAA